MKYIFSYANLYATMSRSFYEEHLQSDGQDKEVAAISAVIFQALAIEAYINLWGADTFGVAVFEEKYERNFSSRKKLTLIAEANSSVYPEEHLNKIETLFLKRNELVHSKAKEYTISPSDAYDYEHPENNYSDLLQIISDLSFVFDGIDEQMTLYEELQENIKAIRKADAELIDEIVKKQIIDTFAETKRILQETINSV